MQIPQSELSNTCSDEAGLNLNASCSKSTELLDSSAVGKTSTQSELREDIAPSKGS